MVVSIASFLRKARLSVVVHRYTLCEKDKNFCVLAPLGYYFDLINDCWVHLCGG